MSEEVGVLPSSVQYPVHPNLSAEHPVEDQIVPVHEVPVAGSAQADIARDGATLRQPLQASQPPEEGIDGLLGCVRAVTTIYA